MPACVKNDCSGAEASIRIPGYRNLDEILIYDIRSSNVWWKADDKQAERQFMLEWTGRTREWKEDNRESPDLMICAGHFTESQIKDGRRIQGELPHSQPIPAGHDLSKPLPDFRKPRTYEVLAARRAEAEEAVESRRQKAQAAAATRAERDEELRMAALAQEMDDKLDAEANWVVTEILRMGPDAIKRILIEKSLLENKLAAATAENDRAHTLGREQAHRIRYLSRKVRTVKAAARNLAARVKEQKQMIKALLKKYKRGKLDLAGLEKALLAEQKKGARLLEYDYIMANPAWAQALTGITRPQLTRLVGDLEEDDYLERILGPVKTSSGATMSRSHLPAKDILARVAFATLLNSQYLMTTAPRCLQMPRPVLQSQKKSTMLPKRVSPETRHTVVETLSTTSYTTALTLEFTLARMNSSDTDPATLPHLNETMRSTTPIPLA